MKNEKNRKYEQLGFSIEVDLHYKNYCARGNILKTDKKDVYDITLELRRKDIGKWDMLDEEHYSLASECINLRTYDFIMDKFANGFFKKFIDRYEYELKCLEDYSTAEEREKVFVD